mmetsp:Transcript_73681/g.193313  ORF Transcript_73681/g.193313 Transcript_73681/m.193313 type:complete len:617 (-) Transcript_73681:73-1923(-)
MVLWNDEIFGMDTDEVFGYSTKKVVWIRDRWIGAIYYGIIMCVMLWVVGGQIVWRNEQYLLKDVKGLARIWYNHPTVDNCESNIAGCKSAFKPLDQLPYCNAFAGLGAGSNKAHCEYQSKVSIAPGGEENGLIFIPTAVEIITEREACEPSEENGFTCDNEYEALPGTDCLHDKHLCQKRGGLDRQFFYVADVKNFKLRFTSSYERENIRGTSLMHPAYVGLCQSMMREQNTTRSWQERRYRNQEVCERRALKRYKMRCLGGNCTQARAFDVFDDTGVRKAVEDVRSEATVVSESIRLSGLSRARVGSEETVLLATESRTESRRELQRHRQTDAERTREQLGEHNTGALRALRSFARAKKREQQTEGGEAAKSDLKPPSWLSLSRLSSFGEEVSSVNPSESQEYEDSWGDVFTVGRLFELAGADLDNDYNMDTWTTRQSGTALQVRAVYNNLYPLISSFGYRDVEYHYEVRELMLPYMSRTELAPVQPAGYPKVRKYVIRYGVLISFEVGGTFGFFNVVYLILMLTTAFALTASATTITDLMGIYVFSRRDNFFHLKYEVSPDFSSTWKCETCAFHNVMTDRVCVGVPKFKSRMDYPACGAPRPAKYDSVEDFPAK